MLDFERLGFITPTPRLLALSAISELIKYGAQASTLRQLNNYENTRVTLTKTQQVGLTELQQRFEQLTPHEQLPSFETLIYEKISHNPVFFERAVPLFFDFDINQDSISAHSQEHKLWQRVTWREIILRLTASGHLDRADILTRCLLALRRDFRRPLLTWFKELFLALRPTPAERLARQAELTELLAHPLPLVVNFALDQLKDLWTEPAFRLDALLLYAEGLLTRQDLKTGIKTLLGGFGKLLKRHPAQAPTLARLYAAALAHADGAVQERAARGLADLLQAKKPLLTPAETAETTDSLRHYADLLGPAARALVAPWLAAAEETATPTEPGEAYAPLADFQPEISPATAIAPVADWHELLFLTGQVLKHDDPGALERWVDGLLRLQGHWPADYAAALQPYVQRILPYLKDKTATEQAAILKNPSLPDGHAGLAQALVLSWANGFAAPLLPRVSLRETYSVADPLVAVEQQRLAHAERLLRQRQPLPLLSTPTHAPHWLAPEVLVQRLLAYQAAGEEPMPADVAVALARLAYASPGADAARPLLPTLDHEGLRELLGWLLAAAPGPLPVAATGRKSLLKQFTERLGQLLPPAAAPTPAALAEALPWLWAVAARTRQPAAEFPALAALTPGPCPGVVGPWQPRWALVRESNTYVEKWKPGKPEVTNRWTELRIEPATSAGAPAGAAPSGLLLYSLHAALKPGHAYHRWHHTTPLVADFPFLEALVPRLPAPLHWHLLGLVATRDAPDSSAREGLSQALRGLLTVGPAFDEAAALLLAVGLTNNAPVCRALALEVLLAAVPTRRLDPTRLGQALGQLLAADFVPIPRLSDNLAQARAIDTPTDDALRQTLEALLPELPAAPLRNTRKLLEAYADLVGRTRRPVPPAVQARLREWQATPALKKVATGLLA
ncbi:hypothetical protein HNP98_000430 [Hymenobacter sp. 9A]|uniref:HEAT repeat domain-containing protein n=1 Tax=Hymenobacter caeli TaxID=2735894 RepID=A0ABX2FKH9_9BACT|nr:hypothetical protein [Hymenobacter caeli]